MDKPQPDSSQNKKGGPQINKGRNVKKELNNQHHRNAKDAKRILLAIIRQ